MGLLGNPFASLHSLHRYGLLEVLACHELLLLQGLGACSEEVIGCSKMWGRGLGLRWLCVPGCMFVLLHLAGGWRVEGDAGLSSARARLRRGAVDLEAQPRQE